MSFSKGLQEQYRALKTDKELYQALHDRAVRQMRPAAAKALHPAWMEAEKRFEAFLDRMEQEVLT